jgi:hypothetical protein
VVGVVVGADLLAAVDSAETLESDTLPLLSCMPVIWSWVLPE